MKIKKNQFIILQSRVNGKTDIWTEIKEVKVFSTGFMIKGSYGFWRTKYTG